MPQFIIRTIGCKVNQYEGQALAALLERTGLSPAQAGAAPDLVVVNTCCVTSRAAAKSRQAIRRAVRTHARASVLILGCYATQDGATLRQAAVDSGCKGRVHVAGHGDDVADCALGALPPRWAGVTSPAGAKPAPRPKLRRSPAGTMAGDKPRCLQPPAVFGMRNV